MVSIDTINVNLFFVPESGHPQTSAPIAVICSAFAVATNKFHSTVLHYITTSQKRQFTNKTGRSPIDGHSP